MAVAENDIRLKKDGQDLFNIVELLHYMYINAKGLETPETLKEEKEEANFNPLVMEFKMAKDYFKSNYEGLNKYKKEMLGRLNKSDYIKAFRVFNLMYLNKYTEEYSDDQTEEI